MTLVTINDTDDLYRQTNLSTKQISNSTYNKLLAGTKDVCDNR